MLPLTPGTVGDLYWSMVRTILFRGRERTSYVYVVSQAQVGSHVDAEVLRGEQVIRLDIELTETANDHVLIPGNQYDRVPSYFVFAGMVFMSLSMNHFGIASDYMTNFRPLLRENLQSFPGQEVVMVLKVLGDDVNRGYHAFRYSRVYSVDGEEVINLSHLVELVGRSEGQLVEFQFSDGTKIVLDKQRALERHQTIMDKYGVPRDRFLGGKDLSSCQLSSCAMPKQP